jgi:hypothetical protein
MKRLYPLFGDKLGLFGGDQSVRPPLGDNVSVSIILYVWACYRVLTCGLSCTANGTTVSPGGGGVGKAPVTVHALFLYSVLFFSKTFNILGPPVVNISSWLKETSDSRHIEENLFMM